MELLETRERGKVFRRVIFGGECFGKYEVVAGGFRPNGRKRVEPDERACIQVVLCEQITKAARSMQMLGWVASMAATARFQRSALPRPYVEQAKRYVGYGA